MGPVHNTSWAHCISKALHGCEVWTSYVLVEMVKCGLVKCGLVMGQKGFKAKTSFPNIFKNNRRMWSQEWYCTSYNPVLCLKWFRMFSALYILWVTMTCIRISYLLFNYSPLQLSKPNWTHSYLQSKWVKMFTSMYLFIGT